MRNLSLTLCFSFCSIAMCWTKEIVIPRDADTIKEAVELAVSNDIILLSTFEVQWGGLVFVENKNLTIKGNLSNQQTMISCEQLDLIHFSSALDGLPRMLYGTNSDLILENINMTDSCRFANSYSAATRLNYPTFMWIDSGNLSVIDSILNVSLILSTDCSIVRSQMHPSNRFSDHDGGYEYPVPAIFLRNTNNSTLEIIDSDIRCAGYKAIQIDNALNNEVKIHNSTVNGEGTLIRSFSCGVDGNPAIEMTDCRDLLLSLTNTSVIGGDGVIRCRLTPNGNERVGYGASAIQCVNSSIYIQQGTLIGGSGRDGYEPDHSYIVFEGTYFNGGNGGHGLFLENSIVHINDTRFSPGTGGIGAEPESLQNDPTLPENLKTLIPKDGQPGKPYLLDESSEIHFVTTVSNWSLY